MEPITLRKAVERDAQDVLRLYHACISVGDCTWNELYPAMEEIAEDIAKDFLYLWEQNGELTGAVSLLSDDDLEHIGLAYAHPDKPCVLCRLCVKPNLQGGGHGSAMLAASERQAAALGYLAMHLLVDQQQHAARRLYERAGYTTVGETEMYGHHFTAMEKAL